MIGNGDKVAAGGGSGGGDSGGGTSAVYYPHYTPSAADLSTSMARRAVEAALAGQPPTVLPEDCGPWADVVRTLQEAPTPEAARRAWAAMTRADPRLWRLVAGGETGPAGNGGGLTFVLLLEFLQTGGGAGERWIWDGYIGHGHVVLLCGAPKSGKTTLVSHLSVAVATGTPFLGRPVEKCPVLWLGLEEARTTVQRRFSQLVAQSPDIPLYVHVGPLPPGVSLEDVIADLREKIAYYRVGLAIIDTLAFFWRLPDENDSSLVIRHISPLLALARETEVGLLLLHHLRKSPGDAGADIRGSSALFASVDVALILRRDGYSPTRRILEAHSRFDETPARLVLDYDLSVPAWRCLGGAEEVRRQDVQEEILGVLSDEPQTTNEIAEAIDRRKADVIRALKELLDMGCVRRDGTGRRGDPARWTLAR